MGRSLIVIWDILKQQKHRQTDSGIQRLIVI